MGSVGPFNHTEAAEQRGEYGGRVSRQKEEMPVGTVRVFGGSSEVGDVHCGFTFCRYGGIRMNARNPEQSVLR